MNEDINVAVNNSNFLVLGGTLHGQLLDVDFIEGVVYVIDDETYICQTLESGSRVITSTTNNLENCIASSMAFVNI